jgi:hypothetical protein
LPFLLYKTYSIFCSVVDFGRNDACSHNFLYSFSPTITQIYGCIVFHFNFLPLKKIGKKILDADEGDTIISKFLKTSPRMLRTIFQATRRHTYKLVDHKHVSSFILAIHKHGVQSCSRFDRPVIRH